MTTKYCFRPCIQQARKERRCIIPSDGADARALSRLYRSGKLLRPHRGTYAEPEIWNAMSPWQRSVALSKALALQHPTWIFAGISAAAIQELPHRNHLHSDGHIYVASEPKSYTNSKRTIQHIRMQNREHIIVNSLRVTPVARTLLDCGARYSFRDALVMYDYALRQNLTDRKTLAKTLPTLLNLTSSKLARIHALLKYASPLSESVGESLCRGTMLEAGFTEPRQQVIHIDQSRAYTYRTDFEFTAADSGTVIVEFDGTQKYIDPSMTDNRTIREVIHQEQRRERTLAAESGVKQIIRFDYEQVMQRTPVVRALVAAGVPRASTPPLFTALAA